MISLLKTAIIETHPWGTEIYKISYTYITRANKEIWTKTLDQASCYIS